MQGIAQDSPLPVSVKVRIAAPAREVNVREVVSRLRESGAAAVTIHGRTADARYSKSADWSLISDVVKDQGHGSRSKVSIIGNGDILTHYEARQRMEMSGVDGVMVGRGALIKPWIFDEFRNGRVSIVLGMLPPSPHARTPRPHAPTPPPHVLTCPPQLASSRAGLGANGSRAYSNLPPADVLYQRALW